MSSSTDWHWHARAWMARRRWAATRERIERWLLSVRTLADVPRELLLLGGSAGWMMSPAFLAGFERVLLVDMDPWAPRLLRLNHGAALSRHGVLLDFLCGDVHERLDEALARHPGACVLFDNFLGLDSIYTRSLELTGRRKRTLRQTLAPVAWGSVHDRLSGPGTEQGLAIPPLRTVAAGSLFGTPAQQDWLRSIHAQSPWGDHLTAEVFPRGTPLAQIAWPFKPGHWHWLEMGWRPARRS